MRAYSPLSEAVKPLVLSGSEHAQAAPSSLQRFSSAAASVEIPSTTIAMSRITEPPFSLQHLRNAGHAQLRRRNEWTLDFVRGTDRLSGGVVPRGLHHVAELPRAIARPLRSLAIEH